MITYLVNYSDCNKKRDFFIAMNFHVLMFANKIISYLKIH